MPGFPASAAAKGQRAAVPAPPPRPRAQRRPSSPHAAALAVAGQGGPLRPAGLGHPWAGQDHADGGEGNGRRQLAQGVPPPRVLAGLRVRGFALAGCADVRVRVSVSQLGSKAKGTRGGHPSALAHPHFLPSRGFSCQLIRPLRGVFRSASNRHPPAHIRELAHLTLGTRPRG